MGRVGKKSAMDLGVICVNIARQVENGTQIRTFLED